MEIIEILKDGGFTAMAAASIVEGMQTLFLIC
jgi:hypothetical protein